MQKKPIRFELDGSTIHLLHRASQCADTIFGVEMDASGHALTPRQLAVLLAIEASDDASQTTLVDKTGIDRSTIANMMRRMMSKGLVQRQRTKEDQRAYAVNLTKTGRQVLEQASLGLTRVDQALLAALPKADRKAFLQTLKLVSSQLGKSAPV